MLDYLFLVQILMLFFLIIVKIIQEARILEFSLCQGGPNMRVKFNNSGMSRSINNFVVKEVN